MNTRHLRLKVARLLLTVGGSLLVGGCNPPPAAPPAEPPKQEPQPTPPLVVPATPNGGQPTGGTDHVMFGGTPDRNMVNLKDKLEKFPTKGPDWNDDEAAKKWSAEWVLWREDLGSRSYGGPIIAGGKVFVGTNNERPRNKRDFGKNMAGEMEPTDKGILMCFDEKSGKFLWQAVHDKLASGQVHDWPKEGLCSTAIVEGDRVYYVSNRCTVVCADVNGMTNGKQGKGLQFVQDPLDPMKKLKPEYADPIDADVLWEFDMIDKLNVFPHNMSACSPLIVGDVLYVVTANGVDEGHINIPSPEAPSFIALNKKTGELIWKSNAPGKNIMHGQWSNPVSADHGGTKQVIFPGGDGWLYGFTPDKGELLWKFDCNPKDAIYELGGTGTKSDFIGTPVVHDGKVYVGVGQDPEHTTGIGHFWSIDLAKALANAAKSPDKDVSRDLVDRVEKLPDGKEKVHTKPNPASALVWTYGGEETRPFAPRDFKFGRTMSTACIVDDIIYISELAGFLHCINAKTGEHYWQFDTKASIWGSPYYVDGKVLLATEGGDLWVFRHDKQPQKIDELAFDPAPKDMKEARTQMLAKRKQVQDKYLLAKVEFDGPIRSTPVVANGVLYVMSEKSLFAIKTK
jgi:outer membrane protein assembly factor BamB